MRREYNSYRQIPSLLSAKQNPPSNLTEQEIPPTNASEAIVITGIQPDHTQSPSRTSARRLLPGYLLCLRRLSGQENPSGLRHSVQVSYRPRFQQLINSFTGETEATSKFTDYDYLTIDRKAREATGTDFHRINLCRRRP
ncbi:MAG: hypothetical protein U0L09_00950 [Christensenellales bacterium]|nr:hypothetical protein [Christensenellales bacterium]